MLARGSILNAVLVLAGGLLGGAVGRFLSPEYEQLGLSGLGLVTLVIGMKMALGSKNVLIVAAAISLGGMLGLAIGIPSALDTFARQAQTWAGASSDPEFVGIVVGASVLYCVGPMTLLGCIQDRLENKIELLALKSAMDGIAAIFFGATSWLAMVVTAGVVLVVQVLITLAAKPLKPIAEDQDLLAELTGAGGVMLLGTGFSLLAIKKLPVAAFLPALLLAPVFVLLARRFSRVRPAHPS